MIEYAFDVLDAAIVAENRIDDVIPLQVVIVGELLLKHHKVVQLMFELASDVLRIIAQRNLQAIAHIADSHMIEIHADDAEKKYNRCGNDQQADENAS